MTDFDDMLKRAEDGDPTAQGFLAHAFFNGEGVAENKEVARYWLLKAVAGKAPWSLTVRAIELRSMGDPTSLTESARLLESVREHQVGLQSFRSMSRIEARRKKASALRLRFSQSFASLRQRLSQAMVRSTIQRLGNTANPLT